MGAGGDRPRKLTALLLRVSALWFFTAASVALDAAFRAGFIAPGPRLLWWSGSVVFSLAAWNLCFAATARLHRRSAAAGRAAVIVLGGLAGFLTVVSVGFFGEFSTWPTTFAFLHALTEPREALGYVLKPLFGWYGFAVAAVMAAMIALWLRALERAPRPSGRRVALDTLLVVAGLVGFGLVRRHASFMIPDASAAKVLVDAAVNTAVGGLHGRLMDARRPPLPALRPDPAAGAPPNVVLVIGESLSASHLGLYGNPRDTSPELQAWAAEQGEGFVRFERAVASATVTKVSLPTILSGLSPTRSPLELHSNPLLWHYAKALGYDTALVTAQSFAWNNLEGFFIDKGLDRVFTLETSGHPVANSTGMDDALMMDEAVAYLGGRRGGPPFLLTLQFNGTHYPGFSHPEHRVFDEQRDPNAQRDNAVLCMDFELGRLRRALRETGLDKDTVVVVLADHGSSTNTAHEVHRTESYYQDALEVPLVVIVPERLRAAWGERFEALRENRRRRVSLADVVPTIVDALGIAGEPSLAAWTRVVDGASLLTPIDPERPILAVNTDENFRWSRQGFAVIIGDWKYIYYDWLGPGLYDLAADPNETRNLLRGPAPPSGAAALAHARALDVVRREPVLDRIQSR